MKPRSAKHGDLAGRSTQIASIQKAERSKWKWLGADARAIKQNSIFQKEQRIMTLREMQVSKEVFNNNIRTTFGKLDEQDIAWIDGRSSALAHQLCLRYGYETVDAEHRVELFESKLDRGRKVPTLGMRM